jgi:hypothetical protein
MNKQCEQKSMKKPGARVSTCGKSGNGSSVRVEMGYISSAVPPPSAGRSLDPWPSAPSWPSVALCKILGTLGSPRCGTSRAPVYECVYERECMSVCMSVCMSECMSGI